MKIRTIILVFALTFGLGVGVFAQQAPGVFFLQQPSPLLLADAEGSASASASGSVVTIADFETHRSMGIFGIVIGGIGFLNGLWSMTGNDEGVEYVQDTISLLIWTGGTIAPSIGMLIERKRLIEQMNAGTLNPNEGFPFLTYAALGYVSSGVITIGIGVWMIAYFNAIDEFAGDTGFIKIIGYFPAGVTMFAGLITLIPGLVLLGKRGKLKKKFRTLQNVSFHMAPMRDGMMGGFTYRF